MNKYTNIAGIIGNPSFYGEGFRDYSPETMRTMREYGFDTVFVNIAWSRPFIDSVIPEHVMVSKKFPLISPPDVEERFFSVTLALADDLDVVPPWYVDQLYHETLVVFVG